MGEPQVQTALEKRTIRKAFLHLMPLLLLAYFAAYINRVNIGFAASMREDLGLTAQIYGLGAGLFFIGYFFFEVPSNLFLVKFGARKWIARIMVTWGLLSMGMALVEGPVSFYVLRFFLGVAEAGFFPGIILYITFWFPSAVRARILAAFMVAIPASLAITGPISNMIMDALGGVWGLADWQWLFIVEGAPTVPLAFVVLWLLPDRPKDAKWLEPEERDWLQGEIDREARHIETHHTAIPLLKALTDLRVLALAYIYFASTTTNLALAFFMPQIIAGIGVSDEAANYISAIPFMIGIVAVLVFGYLADRFKAHRQLVLIIALGISAVGLAGAGALGATVASFALIGVAAIGIYGAKSPFWPLPGMFLTGAAAAVCRRSSMPP